MKKTVLFCVMLMLGSTMSFGQTWIFSGNGRDNVKGGNFGPNRLHYVHSYSNLGVAVDDGGEDYLETKQFPSWQFRTGIRYKLRLFEYLALGADLSYSWDTYRLRQREDKLWPSLGKQDKEFFRFQHLRTGGYIRFNFTNRGDVLGPFLDVGAHAMILTGSAHKIKNKIENPTLGGAELQEVKNKKLQYVERFGYGVEARLALNAFSIYGLYRMSDLFIPEIAQLELPRLQIGFEFGVASD